MSIIQNLKCWPFSTKDIENFNCVVDYRIETESFEVSLPINRHSPQTLAFNDITLSIGGRNILQNVHGLAKPGKITAILGPSGSGKTTLLNSVFGLKRVDNGVITLNGKRLNKDLRRKMAYVQQHDTFLPYLTLNETFQYHAELKLPSHWTKEEKKNYVDSLTSFYNMNDPKLLKTRMGDVLNRGLSGGEMKRANIICESMSKAPVMLLDEPTTGLDSHNALNVVKMISRFADKYQKTIITTVHQPSKKILSYFDNILVMSAGEVAYFGKRDDLSETLAELNLNMETGDNPADFIIEQLYTENRSKLIEVAQKRHEEKSSTTENLVLLGNGNSTIPPLDMRVAVTLQNEKKTLLLRNEGIATESSQPSGRSSMFSHTHYLTAGNEDNLDFDKWPTSSWQQFKILFWRNFVNSAKMTLTVLNIVYTLLLMVVVSALWFRIKMKEENLKAIKGIFFFYSFFWSMHCTFEAYNATLEEIAVMNKERASGMYRLSAYCLAKIISEMLVCSIRPAIFHLVVYLCFSVHSAAAFFGVLGMILICAILSQCLGMFVGSLRVNMRKGNIICSLICIPSILFGNFFVPSVPSWIWYFQFLSPVYYNFKAMLAIHFTYGAPVRCSVENSIYPECVSGNATFISPESLLQGDGTIWLWIVVPVLSILLICVLIYLCYRFIKRPAKATAKNYCFCC